ncbi:MAG TPA: hypothetical protein PLP86_06820 [Armatimonadota bacterium]|nr:hypothetical protein [Armatimonadota bacterium]
MRRTMFWLVASVVVILMLGCGYSIDRDTLITIEDFDVQPNELVVPVGTTVVWSNTDNISHRIVSGELDPVTFPEILEVQILNNRFSPDDITIALGDSILFRNTTPLIRQIEVKENATLQVVFVSPRLNQNETALFTPDSAGRFLAIDSTNTAIQTIIDVVGVADPDGLFDSGVLLPGENFEFTFNTPGTFPYFCSNHQIANGVVIVEAD